MIVNWRILLSLSFVFALYSPGAVLVHLQNGTELEAKNAVSVGDVVQLSIDRGTIELSASDIERLETVSDPAPPPAIRVDPSLSAAELLDRASQAVALPSEFVRTVAKAESGLRSNALSAKGALGLMQLMPTTSAELGVNREVPAENALGGARYLRALLIRYRGDARLALAAYNAGPAAVDRYHGVPPFPETIGYVNRVLREYEKSQSRLTTR
jgi:soluble lytic murein transglycosylase-like protein